MNRIKIYNIFDYVFYKYGGEKKMIEFVSPIAHKLEVLRNTLADIRGTFKRR